MIALEDREGFEPTITELQSAALTKLGYRSKGKMVLVLMLKIKEMLKNQGPAVFSQGKCTAMKKTLYVL